MYIYGQIQDFVQKGARVATSTAWVAAPCYQLTSPLRKEDHAMGAASRVFFKISESVKYSPPSPPLFSSLLSDTSASLPFLPLPTTAAFSNCHRGVGSFRAAPAPLQLISMKSWVQLRTESMAAVAGKFLLHKPAPRMVANTCGD